MENKTVTAVVEELLPGTMFRVRTSDEAARGMLAHLSGKMRIHRIRVLTGDKVIIEFSPYDDTKGRIIKRL